MGRGLWRLFSAGGYDYRSLYREPDWMRSPRGPDVSPELRWYPVVTLLQLTLDMPIAGRLRPCLRPGALHRRMDRGDGCSQLVARRSRATEAIPFQEAVRRDRCSDHPSWRPCDSALSVILSGAAGARRACCYWTSHQDGSGRARARSENRMTSLIAARDPVRRRPPLAGAVSVARRRAAAAAPRVPVRLAASRLPRPLERSARSSCSSSTAIARCAPSRSMKPRATTSTWPPTISHLRRPDRL